MHICSLSKPHYNGRWALEAGDWLLEDISAFELATDAERGTATVMPYHKAAPCADPMRSILIVANGGFGDAILATPALRALRKKYPDSRIALSTRKRIHPVFDNLPFAPELLDYPVPMRVASEFSTVLTFEHLQESSEEGRTFHASDVKARVLGVNPLEGDARRAEYVVSAEEAAWASNAYPATVSKRIGIQLQASSLTRTYHAKRGGELMEMLYRRGYELFLFGSPGAMPVEAVPEYQRGRIHNLMADGLTFRQSAAVMARMDCVFCPDSSAVHLCGALRVKAVAVFGSTHWKLRTADYPSVLVIQGHGPCSPCWFHPKGAALWPKGQICEKNGFCQPLMNIDPGTILDKIQKQLAKS